MSQITLGTNIELESSNKGKLVTTRESTSLLEAGVLSSGWIIIDDLRFNPYNTISLDLSDSETQTTLRHITGRIVVSFSLISREPNGKCDIEIVGLSPREWYRLEFNTVLAQTDSGYAHAQSGDNGELMFTGVSIPDNK
jgi:hypothetical protein